MEEEQKFFDVLRVIKRRARPITFFLLLFLCAGYLWYKFSTKTYESSAVILPLGGSGNSNALLAQFASIASGFSSSSAPGDQSSANITVLLDSRSLAERVVEKLNLTKHYYEKDWDLERNQWKSNLSQIPTNHDAALILLDRMAVSKNVKNGGSLTIETGDKDPNLALEINKTILSELQKYLNENILTQSKRQRLFVEKQLMDNTKELLEAGKEITNFYQKNRVSNVFSVTDVNLYLRDVSADFEPAELQNQLNDKIKSLQNQSSSLEQKKNWGQVKDVPQQVYLEYLVQKKRILDELAGLFSQQYVMAKMDEAKERVSFLIVDEPMLAKKPIKPNKKQALGLSLILGLFVAFIYVFYAEYRQKMERESQPM